MSKQAARALSGSDTPSDAGVQKQLASIENVLANLAMGGVDAVMMADGPLLLGGARAAVARSEARYRHLIDRMAALVLELAPTGEIVYLNKVITPLTGFSMEDLNGCNLVDLLMPLQETTTHDALRRQFLENGELSGFQTQIQTCTGGYKTISWNSAQVQGVDGQVERLFLFGTDVTQQVLAEEELRIAAVAFESQNGMVITDPNGVILRVNSAFTRLTGYSAAEAIGKTTALLKSGRHDRLFYQRMWDSLKERGYWQGEIWNRRKNGQIYAELLNTTAIISPDRGITHYVANFSDITENKEAEAEIHRLAYYDSLTRLPNRRLLQDRLAQAVTATARSGLYGAIFFIDLDHFKALNDTRGHDVGDLLLIEVAQRLRAAVRESDTVARQGGDEFVVLLEDLSADVNEAAALAKQLGDKLREQIDRPFDLNGYAYRCKLSIGVGLFDRQDTVEELFKRADLALYQAKNAGRNLLRFFDPAMQTALDLRSAMEGELQHAMAAGQLQLFYQPQVDATRRVIGAEALLRWQHPQRGLVLPNHFIPLAEDTGLIIPVGLWVLQTACAQLKKWADQARFSALQLAVNVSGRQFRQGDFVARVEQVLAASGVNPQRLKIELTESLVLEDVADTIEKMQALRRLGVSFAMDDFGTGYSSLSYLAQLPIDQLKIDRSFICNLPGKNNDETITRTIITLGRGLSMSVIAEGVETVAQHEFLAAHGCDVYQGFLFSRPLPLDEFEAFVLARG